MKEAIITTLRKYSSQFDSKKIALHEDRFESVANSIIMQLNDPTLMSHNIENKQYHEKRN